MPLNRTNTRNSHRTAFAGITEYATLRRRRDDGKFLGAPEQWLVQFMPAEESTVAVGEGEITVVKRDIKFFRVPGCKFRPPRPYGQVTRKRDGSVWEIPAEAPVNRQGFGNYVFKVRVTLANPEPL